MDIETQLKSILDDLYSNSITEKKLTEMLEESKSTNIYVYYLLVLTKYFPIQEFTIALEELKKNIMFISIYPGNDIDSPCLYLMIQPEKIHIENLNKCGPYKGTDMMFRVIEYAKEVKIPKLELTDKSKIYLCDKAINLAYLNILTTGQSWYNSKGFISEQYNEEKTKNLLVIGQPFSKLVNIIVDNLTNPDIDMPSIFTNLKQFESIKPFIKSFITDMKELNRNLKDEPEKLNEIKIEFRKLINDAITADNNSTIQQVFQNIQRQFRSFPNSNCTPEQQQLIRIINIIITMLSHNSLYDWASDFKINYNYSKLEYTVPLSGGKKNKTKKRKNKYY